MTKKDILISFPLNNNKNVQGLKKWDKTEMENENKRS